jgi:hypothetical protein
MSLSRRPWFLLVPVLLVLPSGVSGQQLKTGTWTGTVTPPDGPMVEATFDVRESGDSVTIMLSVEFGDFPFSDIEVSSDRLTFRFEPGTPVDCVLMLQENGSYSGDCTDSDGEIGVLVMTPPEGTPSSSAPRAGAAGPRAGPAMSVIPRLR